jgi:hypothetical protein
MEEVSIRFAHLTPCKKVGRMGALIWGPAVLTWYCRKFKDTVKIIMNSPPCVWVPLAIRPLWRRILRIARTWIISIVGRFSPRFRFFKVVCENHLGSYFIFKIRDLWEPSWVQIFFPRKISGSQTCWFSGIQE